MFWNTAIRSLPTPGTCASGNGLDLDTFFHTAGHNSVINSNYYILPTFDIIY